METFYLIDFENVHNEGIENIKSLSKTDHVHIFSTEKALNIRIDLALTEGIDIHSHIVPVRNQSLDMHLVSYLGYLLAKHGEKCSYVIVSKDTDYDNIINFWKKEFSNISREQKIPRILTNKRKTSQAVETATTQTVNSKINAGMAYNLSGDDRSELNQFMQHGLVNMGYPRNETDRICKCVIAHCNDERMLSEIHNDLRDLRKKNDDYLEVYMNVKTLLGNFKPSKTKIAKRESQIRSFFGQHFRKKTYVDNKEEIICIILNAKSKQQINNKLMKMYADGNTVKHIYQTIQPLIKDLPGK